MGSSSSKFRRYLLNGDEYAALEIFHSSSVLRHSLNPNYSYGDSLQHNSPLHLAAKHAMKPLLRIFLNELGGNPNERNAASETALHLACQGNHVKSLSTQERRFACVMLILQWQGSHENPNKVHLFAVDNKGDTPLHNAAATGLKKCVEALACHGAPLFIENEASETPCDIAEKNEHEDIAQYLEIKMVFSSDMLANSQELESSSGSEQECTGLRTLDLQEAKDQLLVETSDMLHIPLFTSEVLLRNHEWSRQSLLDTWMQDPVKCCKEAGVEPPTSALQFDVPDNSLSLKVSCQQIQDEYQNESLNSPMRNVPLKDEIICSVCMTFIPKVESPVQVPCHHQFCMSCWKGYLTTRIQDGEVHNILCPEFECHHLIPVGVIEKLVSQDVAKRYLQFDIEAFVGSNPNIQWCPYPGCERAVKLPDTEIVSADLLSSNATTPLEVSHSVDCGNGHYFCWECLSEAHAPCGCEKWKEWHRKILEIKPEELKNTCKETENAANCLWMVTNSKPCPNCKSPIQKNEGCNHMKCSKCKFDYCWVCLEAWKKHSSATGGYFRCNRFDAVQRVEVRTGVLISEAETHNNHMQELKKFLHYYTRFHENETSYKLEKPFAKLIKKKSEVFRAALTSVAKSEVDLNFFDEAIHELLYARRILCGSFVYGYYLEDNGYNKTIFEYMQCDLKDSTEKLSKMIACNYLQTPCKKIIQATRLVKQKRIDFITAILKGLIPPETPPSMRKSQKRRYPGLLGIDPAEDEQLSQAIMASLEDLDPRNPWVKDPQGRHTNLAAIFDWPDYDEDKEETNSSNMLATNLLGVCTREHCMKPRARNPRTGQIHEYCSLICKYNDLFGKEDEKSSCAEVDFSTELLLALEISKLQMVKDENMEIETATANDSSYMFSGNAHGVRVIGESMEESPGETHEYLHITDELTQASENSATEGAQDDLHRISESTESCNDVVPNTSSLMPSKTINFYLKSPGDANYLNSVNTNDQIQSLKKTEKDLFIFVSNSHSNSASKKTNVDSS